MSFQIRLACSYRSIILLLCIIGLLGCGGGGGGGAGQAVDAIVTGYYDTGTARVKETNNSTDLVINDLQALAHNNRLILMSVSQGLIFDGTISINGNGFTGTLNVYRDGRRDVQNSAGVTVSGTINQRSSLSGDLNGAGAANGSFRVNYALSNNQIADIGRIGVISNVWSTRIGGAMTETFFFIGSTGDIVSDNAGTDGNFATCEIASPVGVSSAPDFSPINGTSLYSVTSRLGNCIQSTSADSVNAGFYLGLATSRSDVDPDDTLVFVGTSENGEFSIGGDFK